VINRYSDHAANERTFMAWVRTAIAVMAFGFLVEKFDLFLEVAARSLAGKPPSAITQIAGNIAGLLLILLGGAMMVVATLRYRQTARDIEAAEVRQAGAYGLDETLVLLLLGLGIVLFVFLLYTVVRRLG
jgi:putative membrane protein